MPTNQIYRRKTALLVMFGALILMNAFELLAAEISWPLKVSNNRRYLIERDGTAFFYLCDTAWRLFDSTTFSEAKLYMDDRAGKGFSVIHAPLLVKPGPVAASELIHPNEDYFDSSVSYVEYARSKGLTVNIIPAWMGSNGHAWEKAFKTLTKKQVINFGRYVGNKFHHCDNIIYSMGGEFLPIASL